MIHRSPKHPYHLWGSYHGGILCTILLPEHNSSPWPRELLSLNTHFFFPPAFTHPPAADPESHTPGATQCQKTDTLPPHPLAYDPPRPQQEPHSFLCGHPFIPPRGRGTRNNLRGALCGKKTRPFVQAEPQRTDKVNTTTNFAFLAVIPCSSQRLRVLTSVPLLANTQEWQPWFYQGNAL